MLIPELRRGIQQANPHLAIGECTTMAEAVEDSIGAQKLTAQVVGVFGGLVLLITVVGLYGLLSYLVAQRTQEIGIRMALGADRGRLVAMVMRQTLIWLGAGTVIGVGLAMAGGRLLEGFLFGVSTRDPWTIGLAPVGAGRLRSTCCNGAGTESGFGESCGSIKGGLSAQRKLAHFAGRAAFSIDSFSVSSH